MIQLLFMVVLVEGVVALLLMLKIGPLRELVMKGLEQVKMGRGPATVKTIACTMAVILASSVTGILKIQNKGVKLGTLSPMEQVLWRTQLLEASLIGKILKEELSSIIVQILEESGLAMNNHSSLPRVFVHVFGAISNFNGLQAIFSQKSFSLFLGFVIDCLHNYLNKLMALKSVVGDSKKDVEKLQKEHRQFKEKEEKATKEIVLLKEEISKLKENLKKLKLESEEKDKKVQSAEAHVVALQKQSEELLLEYDRLLEDNQNLQTHILGYKG
ncbi:hypothetical protein Syun_030519 [Stephania yunnanensis]|uniref:Endoplasmic reticulum transmembrane protein n=1 Tax=Stephania yunnanensis TaxID=152371 RepID=A0AAP0DU91_9MAGN